MKRFITALAVAVCLLVPVWAQPDLDPKLWREDAQKLILQGQAFKDEFTDEWRYNLLLAGSHNITDKTAIGGVVSYLSGAGDEGFGAGPWYEYSLYQNDHGLSLFIGGDAQFLTGGAEDIAAWQAATRIGIEKQAGNIAIRVAVEVCRAIDGEEETILVPTNGPIRSTNGETPFPATVTIDRGDSLDRFGLLFGISWGRTPTSG